MRVLGAESVMGIGGKGNKGKATKGMRVLRAKWRSTKAMSLRGMRT